MATRSNALSEITRFWLQDCHELFLRESVPVKLDRNMSDIDFMVTTGENNQAKLLDKIYFHKAIVETKDERDYDYWGKDFLKRVVEDKSLMVNYTIPTRTKCNFSMLREEHHSVAKNSFGTDDFVKILIVHHLPEDDGTASILQELEQQGIYFIRSYEMLDDIHKNFEIYRKNAGIRNSLLGDVMDFLVRYHKWIPRTDCPKTKEEQ